MKKILLVDDESHIVSGLRMLIKRYFGDRYSVVAEAGSGKEAIEKAKEYSPDIILIDVQMPGISGLDVIRTLSQSGSSKAFVLITAYERFEIAREALKLGVCDYLLKPVSRDRLEVALNSASLYLERSRFLEDRELALLEREKRLVPYLKQAFFHVLGSGTAAEEDIDFLLTLLHQQRKTACIAVACFLPEQRDQVFPLYQRFSRFLQFKTDSLVSNLLDNRYCIVYIPVRDPGDLRAFHQGMRREFDAELSLGDLVLAYGTTEHRARLSESFRKAMRSLFMGTGGFESFTTLRWPIEWDQRLMKEAEEGRMGNVVRQMEEILSRLNPETPLFPHEVFRILTLLGFLNLKAIRRKILPDETIRELFDFTDLLGSAEKGLTEFFLREVRKRFDQIRLLSTQPYAHPPMVQRALQYIKNHFNEPISLESVADMLNVSPVTLSRLLTEETGMGFAKTLTQERLAKAKALLEEGTHTIKEISSACGYPDPNYFARLFKRSVGMTPREYTRRRKEVENAQRDPSGSIIGSPDNPAELLWEQNKSPRGI